MAAPATINNGDIPDATLLMAWLTFLLAGKGIKQDTYSNLKAIGGTDPFIAIATDLPALVFYVGDATKADAGFISLGGW